MSFRLLSVVTVLSVAAVLSIALVPAFADEVLYSYEGEVLLLDESTGWVIGNPCEDPCSEYVQDGHFVLEWTIAADLVNYDYEIAQPPDDPPPTLWVEWRFRSNDPRPAGQYGCDAKFSVHYGGCMRSSTCTVIRSFPEAGTTSSTASTSMRSTRIATRAWTRLTTGYPSTV